MKEPVMSWTVEFALEVTMRVVDYYINLINGHQTVQSNILSNGFADISVLFVYWRLFVAIDAAVHVMINKRVFIRVDSFSSFRL